MKKSLQVLMVITFSLLSKWASADTNWSAQNYDLYPGDFNGDGKTDLLYISKDPGFLSGIVLSDGTGLNVPLQSWDNTYLGIPWSDNLYNVIVADFNGDGKSDVLLQRKDGGDHYLLLTEEGGIGGIDQTIANDAVGLTWSADQHRIVAGDFNGDGKADLFLQSTSNSGLNAVILADENGEFTASQPDQSWNDGYAGFDWATSEALAYAGDFNGDGIADLLLQAEPFSRSPVQFEPNMNGVVLAQAQKQIFVAEGVQAWSQYAFSADWSPLDSVVVVGDFDGDTRADVLLQGMASGNPSYLLHGQAAGAIFSAAVTMDAATTPASESYRLIAGRFDGGQNDGLYFQSQSPTQSNYLGQISGGTIVASQSDSSLAVAGDQMVVGADSSQPAASGPATTVTTAALVTPTSAGRTPGQFAVSSLGTATYQIPIWTPPGARGLQPHLALVYSSGAPDGTLGPGWSLSGLSSISRCNKTYAANGGAPAPVALTMSDEFCLDGNRLRLTSGTYGAAASVYQTEIANFSRVTANGTAGNGPSYFIVEGKDGLKYEYGHTTDSKAYTSGGSTPYAWMLSKVLDRQGNNLTVTYSTTSGSIQPSTIQYTQTPATGTSYPYTVAFTYQTRTSPRSKYIAGGNVQDTKLLDLINIQSAGVSVRQYNLNYATAPTTKRDRLASIQECGGSAGTDCLRATTVTYQDGIAGVSSTVTTLPFPAGMPGTAIYDFNGDGKPDLLYYNTSAGAYYAKLSTTTGYGAPLSTGVTTPWAYGDVTGEGQDGIVANQGGTLWYYRYDGSAFSGASLAITVPSNARLPALVDTKGSGLPNLLFMQGANLMLYSNTTAGGVPSFNTTPITAYAVSGLGSAPTFRSSDNNIRSFDFNGDGRQDVVVTGFNLCGTPQEPDTCYKDIELLSTGTAFSSGAIFPAIGSPEVKAFAQWNSDACTDLVLQNFSTNTLEIDVSPCTGGTPNIITVPVAFAVATMDWDGDGHSDLLVVNGSTLGVYRSTEVGASALISTTIPWPTTGTTYLAQDLDGDGLDELLNPDFDSVTYQAHKGPGVPPDLATSISDGWNISAAPTYVPITQSNYTKRTDAIFPDFDFQGPMYVVSEVDQSDGTGGTFTNTFQYFGARINRQGRGFKGFYETQIQDSRNSLYRRVYYRQDFPFTGWVSQDDSYQANGTSLISRAVNTYQATVLSGTCNSGRCFPHVSSSTTTHHEITSGSPLIQTTVTNYTYDTSGNATQVSTTTTDNDSSSPFFNQSWSSVVANTVTNDTTNWCLGLPTVTTTQNTVPGQSPVTRRVDHVVDAPNCRFTSETAEPTSTLLKVVTTFGYDTCGNANSVSVVGLDKTGTAMPARATTSDYGSHCTFPEGVTNALGQLATATYNYDFGEKASTIDPNGALFRWTYDNFGRRTDERRPDGTHTTWDYDDCVAATCYGSSVDLRFLVTERLQDTSLATVRTRELFYDGLERLRYDEANRVLGTWTNTQIRYDSLGRKTYVFNPYSSAGNGFHLFSYDILNRPKTDTLYSASGVINRQTLMDYAGLKTTITDPKVNVTSKWTDVTGKLRQVIDPSPGGTTDYTYDPFGNLIQTSDATLKISTNTYNIRGFKTASSDPDAGNWSYTPNSLNELVSQTDAKNQTTTFSYDKLGRMISRLEPESTTATTWTYGTSATANNIGRLQSLSKPDGYAESYTYDSIGRPSQVTYTMDAASYLVNYAYNAIGTVDTLTYPTSTSGVRFALKYVYSYGFLQQVKDNAAGTVFWSLNSANDYGSPLTEVLGNSVTVTSDYTPWTNELTSRQEGTGASVNNLQDLSYQWDFNGNLQQRQDLRQSLAEVFVHDSMNRLTNSTLNGVTNLSVGYDAAGNITTKSDVGSYNYTTAQTGCTYYAHTQPHAVRKAGTTVYCYDANGNMTLRGTSAVTWYSYNQLNRVVNGSTKSATFFYNANHQRWKQIAIDSVGLGTTTTYYIGGILEKVTQSGVTEFRHLIPGGSSTAIHTRRDNGTASTYYVTTDHLGSGDLVMDSAATVLARESFTPFGARRGSNWQGSPTAADYSAFSSTTRRGFTGHEMLDYVNLVHMNGRVYDPYLGRFLSTDPIIQTLDLSQALNPYSYVMNDPLSLIDPSGYSWLSSLFHGIGHFFHNFINSLSHDINVIVGAILIVGGSITGNPWLIGLGKTVMAFPLHVNYDSGQFGFGVGVQFGNVPFSSGTLWTINPNSKPPDSFINGGPPFIKGTRVFYEDGTVGGDAQNTQQEELSWWERIFYSIGEWWNTPNTQTFCNYACGKVGTPERTNTATNGTRVSGVASILISAVPLPGATVFKTAHYALRLEAAGVDIARAESAVASEIAAMRGSMEIGAPVSGRLTIDGMLVEYHAYPLPNDVISVGTIFPVGW